jgi:hypothetical protein
MGHKHQRRREADILGIGAGIIYVMMSVISSVREQVSYRLVFCSLKSVYDSSSALGRTEYATSFEAACFRQRAGNQKVILSVTRRDSHNI